MYLFLSRTSLIHHFRDFEKTFFLGCSFARDDIVSLVRRVVLESPMCLLEEEGHLAVTGCLLGLLALFSSYKTIPVRVLKCN